MASNPLTDADIRHFSRRLRSEQKQLEAELALLTSSLSDVQASRGDGTADDEHDPEGPTMSSEWSRVSGVRDELIVKSDAVRRALGRLADGRYGNCSRCGNPIGAARLEARPSAELCIDCARELESRR